MPLAASVARWSLWEKTVAREKTVVTLNPAAIGGQRGSQTSAAQLRRSVAGELVDSANPLVLAVMAPASAETAGDTAVWSVPAQPAVPNGEEAPALVVDCVLAVVADCVEAPLGVQHGAALESHLEARAVRPARARLPGKGVPAKYG